MTDLDFPAMAEEALAGIIAAYKAAGKDTESEAFQMHLAAKVAEEGGEVLKAYLHVTGWARRGGTWEEFDEELADTVISAFLVAVATGRDLLAAIEAKHKIVMSRGFKELVQ